MTITMPNIMLATILIINLYLVYKLIFLFSAVKYSVGSLDRKLMLLIYGMEEQSRLQTDEDTFRIWSETTSEQIAKRDQHVKEAMKWSAAKWYRYFSKNPQYLDG